MTDPDQTPPLRRNRREGAAPEIHPDLAVPAPSARIPGDLRRPLTRFPTAPVATAVTYTGPGDDLPAPHWAPPAVSAPARRRSRFGPWALVLAIIALAGSYFVWWPLPLALVSIALAVLALLSRNESRSIAGWALTLGILATLISAGWLVWTVMTLLQGG